MNRLNINKIQLTYMTVCFTIGMCVEKIFTSYIFPKFFNTNMLLKQSMVKIRFKPYIYEIIKIK